MKREASMRIILAAILLLLPVLYVGIYLGSLKPPPKDFNEMLDRRDGNYRWQGLWPFVVFWPLEQIDRKIRPGVWGEESP